MGLRMTCPCGTSSAAYDDEFVPRVRAHLTEVHPGRDYDDDSILMFASSVSDNYVREYGDGAAGNAGDTR